MSATSEPALAWYRLHGREQAALIVLLLLAAGLFCAQALTRGAMAQAKVVSVDAPAAKIAINRAGLSELAALPGIGPAKAERIIAARNLAPLRSMDDLKRAAAGVSQANLARMAPFVDFGE